MSNIDVANFVITGGRLPKPQDCPEDIYELMLQCWKKSEHQRPTFRDIYNTLIKSIQEQKGSSLTFAPASENPDDYVVLPEVSANKETQERNHNNNNNNESVMSFYSS